MKPPRNSCLFNNLLKDSTTTPCEKCRKHMGPFGGYDELSCTRFHWWTAVSDTTNITFRVFQGNTAVQRQNDIAEEYRAALASWLVRIEKDYKSLFRAVLWSVPEFNSAYLGKLAVSTTNYRYATACEVMLWLATHKSQYSDISERWDLLDRLEMFLENVEGRF